ncbi:MAG: DUF4012 domain-containing protein [Chloroflexota bacterium]
MFEGPRLRWAGWVLVALGAILVLVWGVGLGRRALSLRGHLAEVASWAEAPESVEPAVACESVRGMRDDVVALDRRAGDLVRLAPVLGWLPAVGGDLRAAPHLLAVGDGLTEAGAIGCDVAGPVLETMAASGGAADDGASTQVSPAGVIDLLAGGRAELEEARRAVERAQAAWERVDGRALSPKLREKASLLDRGLPLLKSGLSAAMVAPELLGGSGPRTYLVLALNEDELRPGGGFISGVGEVHVDAGELITMTFRDGYAVDDFSQPYPPAPEPMERYMGIDLWVFRDSNWSPDFPTAAQQAVGLYRPGYPVSIDGVVALDQQAVQALVAAVDPVRIEGAQEAITGETVLGYIHEAWAPGEEDWTGEWWRQRKSFMGAIAGAVWERVEEGDVEWVVMARSLLRLLEQKHMLVYVPNATMREVLAEQGWDGAVRTGDGDFLMVVDANVGYNKASAKVRQEAVYEVDLSESPPRAGLTLAYTHTSTAEVTCKPESRYAASYEGMMDRCYWDYVRILVPEGSQLVDATGVPVPGEMLWDGRDISGEVTVGAVEEAGCTSWEVMSVIAPGEVQVREFAWTLPPDVVVWYGSEGRYRLRVQKQAGKAGQPLRVRVRLPEEGGLVAATPEPSSVDDGWVTYRAVLDEDLVFDVKFRRGR